MSAVDLVLARLPAAEDRRPFAYNDATGKRVTCLPDGNLTIAEGINLETGLDAVEIDFLDRHRVTLAEKPLLTLEWYVQAGDVRQSVALEIAYNAGLHGLLGYPSMIHFYAIKDWANAAAQCHSKNPKLAGRYAALAQLLLNGELAK
jgi:hypothetical protein